ncbi:vasotab-like [Teleopsis dalmanni]|uniref:vasotab-like n=1 Tax=Teleopsis dalmanni TaxID=139649 RepID=UPI0018CFA2AF|nr:vasotab-like [Teleopsis dalmanni]XP_037939864.1 vasotab-like [Teleopsis dalmanni]
MKFIALIIFALVLVCSIQAQKDDCPRFCPAIFSPVCAFNGKCYKQFGNSCELGASACNGKGRFRQVGLEECSKRGVRLCN